MLTFTIPTPILASSAVGAPMNDGVKLSEVNQGDRQASSSSSYLDIPGREELSDALLHCKSTREQMHLMIIFLAKPMSASLCNVSA